MPAAAAAARTSAATALADNESLSARAVAAPSVACRDCWCTRSAGEADAALLRSAKRRSAALAPDVLPAGQTSQNRSNFTFFAEALS